MTQPPRTKQLIGTSLVELFVQSIAVSHLVKGHTRCSALLLAAPESGKTTIASSASAAHVCRVAVITGRSVLREIKDHPNTEFLLLNDLTTIRAMSQPAVTLLVTILNQVVQDEPGVVAFAGRDVEHIERPVGIIGCLPFKTFTDHRAKWRELGFVSRMVPFAYSYSDALIAVIKDRIDASDSPSRKRPVSRKLPVRTARVISASHAHVETIRRLSDCRAPKLGEIGIRLLQSYHCLVRAHALLQGRTAVTAADVQFLADVDSYVSINECRPLRLATT